MSFIVPSGSEIKDSRSSIQASTLHIEVIINKKHKNPRELISTHNQMKNTKLDT